MKAVAYSKFALRTLSRIPTNEAKRVRDKIEQYAADPKSQANNVKALKGRRPFLRLRVGDWRVIMNDRGSVLGVGIGPRSSIIGLRGGI
jgi:mRNA interferase RelE/StbE